jgi:5,5'-dehydrodivanillate O-demethylase
MAVPQELLNRVPLYDFPYRDKQGEFRLDIIDAQDVMAWVTQGPIALRHLEKLGTTDSGVIQYRKMLQREMAKVARGEDPIGVIRDAAENNALDIPVEKNKAHFSDGFASQIRRTQVQFSPFVPGLIKVFDAYNESKIEAGEPVLA